MNITFADKKLKNWANDNKLAVRKMGAKRAGLFQQRLQDMTDSLSFADLEHLPGGFHQLKGNRAGQWACNLDHPYRLIFEPIQTDNDGKLVLVNIKSLEIIEVVDYH